MPHRHWNGCTIFSKGDPLDTCATCMHSECICDCVVCVSHVRNPDVIRCDCPICTENRSTPSTVQLNFGDFLASQAPKVRRMPRH